jgi:hypothetical protein
MLVGCMVLDVGWLYGIGCWFVVWCWMLVGCRVLDVGWLYSVGCWLVVGCWMLVGFMVLDVSWLYGAEWAFPSCLLVKTMTHLSKNVIYI